MSSDLEQSSEETQHEVKQENGINERLPTNFPKGLRVMVIDDDPVFLQYMEKLLTELLYQVTTYDVAAVTLPTLRAERNNFDIVLCSVRMANMDGFKLLKQILTEMDLPVVMMSSENDVNIVIKCFTEGACDCLIKPIERKDIITIFKHVIRKMMVEHSNETYERECHHKSTKTSDFSEPLGKNTTLKPHKMNEKVINKVVDSSGVSMAKRRIVIWTDEINRKFNAVVEKIGIEKAVPKKILELMNVPGLTRETVASRLQIYRMTHRKSQGYPAYNPNTPINQPESHLAPLSHHGGLDQYSAIFQNPGMQDGQLGRSTRNVIAPLLNNGRFGPDYSNFATRTGYMQHQSQMRGHSVSGLENNYGHSDSILLSQTSHHLEKLTISHLLKPPRMEGPEPKSETTFEDNETNFEGDETKSED